MYSTIAKSDCKTSVITLHETAQTGIRSLPLTTARRRMGHLTQSLTFLQGHLAASRKGGLTSLRQLPGAANQMRQAGLTSRTPGLIHAVAIADQDATPILYQRPEGFLRTLGMNPVQGDGIRDHAPEPLQGMAAVPGRLVNVPHPCLTSQASNGRIVRHNGQGGTVDVIAVFVRVSGLLRHRIIRADLPIAGIPDVHAKTAIRSGIDGPPLGGTE